MNPLTISQIRDTNFIMEFNTQVHSKLDYQTKILSYNDNKFTLKGNKCPAVGHNVQFRVYDTTAESTPILKGTAKVHALDQPNRNDTTLNIVLKIIQTDQNRLTEFERLFHERKDITTYIKSLQVGVISPSATTLRELTRGLSEAGLYKIKPYPDSETAYEAYTKERMDCVLSEWDCESEDSGFKLIQKIRKQPESQATICMVLTSNVTKDRIARAVDNDIDEFVAKPFTPDSLRKAFWNGLKNRKFPTPYTLSIRAASKLIREKEYEKANHHLQIALQQSEHATSAHYYLGYIEMINGNIEKALNQYEKGLEQNENNLKCLFGKAFLLKREEKLDDYYQVLKHILEIYPNHPNSIKDAFPLSLVYDDIQFAAGLLIRLSRRAAHNPQTAELIQKFGKVLMQKADDPNVDAVIKTAVQTVLKKMRVH